MNTHEDHIKAVAERWRKLRLASTMTAEAFEAYARRVFERYGWAYDDIDKIMRRVMRDSQGRRQRGHNHTD